MSSGRYLIDRLTPDTWTIVDHTNLEAALVAFILPCKLKTANWHIIIAETEGVHNTGFFSDPLFIFTKELYSVTFYSNQTDLEAMMGVVLDAITTSDLDIYNLVELTTYMGGQVNYETIPCPPIVIASFH